MPIYSHQCEYCDTIIDKIYRSHSECPDEYIDDCCHCKKKNVKFKKVITGPSGFRLKGEGFFKKTSTFD